MKKLAIEDEISEIMPSQNRTAFDYRLAWARNYLKNYGILENTARGVWAFPGEGKKVEAAMAELMVTE